MPEHEMNGEQSDVLVGLAPADWAAADEIRRRRFAHAPNGYSPEEVHDFLDKLAGMFANLRTQVAELRRVPPAGPAPIEGGTAVSGMAVRMADVLREADSHAASVRQEADRETARLLAEARQEAERTVNEARQEADRMVVAAGSPNGTWRRPPRSARPCWPSSGARSTGSPRWSPMRPRRPIPASRRRPNRPGTSIRSPGW